MPNVILKKTFKVKRVDFFYVSKKMSFSLHGVFSPAIVDEINRILATAMVYARGSNTPQFQLDDTGRYFAEMNHFCQKHHQEDLLVAILDGMENMGFVLSKQHDSAPISARINGSKKESRELFMFRHLPKSHA